MIVLKSSQDTQATVPSACYVCVVYRSIEFKIRYKVPPNSAIGIKKERMHLLLEECSIGLVIFHSGKLESRVATYSIHTELQPT